MELEKIFKFTIDNYSLYRKFDRKLSRNQKSIVVILAIFLKVTFLHIIVRWILVTLIKKMRFNDSVVTFSLAPSCMTLALLLRPFSICNVVYDFNEKKRRKYDNKIIHFSTWMILTAAIVQPDKLLSMLEEAENHKVLKNNTLRVIKLTGLELIYEVLLNNVETIIQFNDHIHYSNLLFELAKKRGIKTVYIQHAPVSYRFPPLHHNLNVLFSRDSFQKYRTVKDDTVWTKILFDLRMLPWFSSPIQERSSATNTILLCTNLIDDLSKVKELLSVLTRQYTVIFRPHPGDLRTYSFEYRSVIVSRNTNIWNDLARVEMVIANESAIVLEALVADKQFYKCSFLSPSIDNYSFLKKGLLIREYATVGELMQALEDKEISYNLELLDYFVGDFSNFDSKLNQLRHEILSI